MPKSNLPNGKYLHPGTPGSFAASKSKDWAEHVGPKYLASSEKRSSHDKALDKKGEKKPWHHKMPLLRKDVDK